MARVDTSHEQRWICSIQFTTSGTPLRHRLEDNFYRSHDSLWRRYFPSPLSSLDRVISSRISFVFSLSSSLLHLPWLLLVQPAPRFQIRLWEKCDQVSLLPSMYLPRRKRFRWLKMTLWGLPVTTMKFETGHCMSLMECTLISGRTDFNLTFVNANGDYFRIEWKIIRVSDRFDRGTRLTRWCYLWFIFERPLSKRLALCATSTWSFTDQISWSLIFAFNWSYYTY